MAYINQEEKKELSVDIKKVLKKYGIKGSIGIRHHSVLVVNIKSGKLDILQNWFDMVSKTGRYNHNENFQKPESLQVNQYWLDNNYSGKVKEFLEELFIAMRGNKWYDRSDIQSDYFDTAYYMNVNVGQWDKPYIVEV